MSCRFQQEERSASTLHHRSRARRSKSSGIPSHHRKPRERCTNRRLPSAETGGRSQRVLAVLGRLCSKELAHPSLLLEQILKCENHNAFVTFVVVADHRVRFAGAGTPIGEHCGIVPVEYPLCGHRVSYPTNTCKCVSGLVERSGSYLHRTPLITKTFFTVTRP